MNKKRLYVKPTVKVYPIRPCALLVGSEPVKTKMIYDDPADEISY